MTLIGHGLMAAAIALCGCGNSSSSSKEACRASAGELTQFLTTMDHTIHLPWLDELRLVTRGDLSRLDVPYAPFLKVGPEEITYMSERFTDHAVLAERLAVTFELHTQALRDGRHPQHDQPDAIFVHLAIDEAVAWETVVAVVELLHGARFEAPSFVFARPPATPPPPRTWLDDELDQKNTDDFRLPATVDTRVDARVFRSCRPLIKAFESVAEVESDKAEHLIRAIGPALVQCNCDVDLAALRTLMWRILGNPRPLSAIQIKLARDARPIALPAATPWREASQHLTPAMTSTWFAIAGSPAPSSNP